jgi:hypothetical protein
VRVSVNSAIIAAGTATPNPTIIATRSAPVVGLQEIELGTARKTENPVFVERTCL